jgi:predicted ribosome quality control (RQC) complex YloA/Tae2 family protein
MTLAGIELRYLVNDLSKITKDYYVSNIYGITRESILFKLHHPEKPDIFLMLSTFGFWTSSVKINQIEQNRLIKRLRSDLIRLKLTKIEQLDAERIAYLTFSGFDKEFVIIGEFFGDGNIILCNKQMKILALLHSIDVRHRQLRVGLQYVPPPQNGLNIFKINQKDLEEIKNSSIVCTKWVGRNLGLPTKYVEEIIRLANVDPKLTGNQLTSDDVKRIFNSVNDVVNRVVEGQHEPVLIKNENGSDVYPIKLGESIANATEVPSFVEGLDILFSQSIMNKGESIQSSASNKKISELENKLEEQTKAISLVKEKSDAISRVAKSLFELVSKGISSIDDPAVKEMLIQNNSEILIEKGIPIMKIHDEKIKIKLDSSIPAIASSLFDEAKHQSSAIKSIEALKKKTEASLTKQKNKSDADKESVTFSEIRKKNWYERYRWFFTSDGLLAIGGRDASSNSSIIRKHLDKSDKAFHAEIFGSPFFILKDSNDTPMASLNEVAHATVCFSRAWREAMYGLSAYWVNPEQIKKAAPSGQFLPKGSFTIDGQRNFVKISTLKLAIGLIKQNEDYILSCGPPEPIKKNSIYYAIIEPSGLDAADTAKKIKIEFLKMNEEIVKPLSIDEFVRVLPAGKSHVTEVSAGEAQNE